MLQNRVQDELRGEKFSYELKAAIFILATFILRVVVVYTSGIELHSDEAYYYLWSKNLSLSYYDHPPMIAYLVALSNLIFGSMEVAVKFVPILLFAGTSAYIFLLGKELFDKRTAFYSLVMINFLPVFVWNSVYASPDIPLLFFLSGASYYFYVAVKRDKVKFWFLASIFTGAGLLSKYLAILIYPSFFCYLLLPENRRYFKRVSIYLCFILSALIFLPVILWNYSNGWISFKYQFARGFEEGAFPNWHTFGDFWGSQLLIAGPILFIIFILVSIYMIVKWKKHSLEEKYLWLLSFLPFVFFMLISLQKRVKVNWPEYIYIPSTLLVFLFYSKVLKDKKYFRKIWTFNWIYTYTLFVLFIAVFYSTLIPAGVVRFYEYFGWRQLGQEVNQIMKENPGFVLAAKRYDFAAEIEAYSGHEIICIGNPKHFDLWGRSRTFFTGFRPYIYCRNGVSDHPVHGNNYKEDLFKIIKLNYGNKMIREVSVFKVYPVPFSDILEGIVTSKTSKNPLIISNIKAVYGEENFTNLDKVFDRKHPERLRSALEALSKDHSVFMLIQDANDNFDNTVRELNLDNELSVIATQKSKANDTYRLYRYQSEMGDPLFL